MARLPLPTVGETYKSCDPRDKGLLVTVVDVGVDEASRPWVCVQRKRKTKLSLANFHRKYVSQHERRAPQMSKLPERFLRHAGITDQALLELLSRYEEYRSEFISQRTHAGLAKARAYGFKGGRPRLMHEATIKLIQALRGEELTYRKIASLLAALGVPTSQGGHWHSMMVWRVMRRDQLQPQAMTLQQIADLLNELGVPTATHEGRWHPSNVRRALTYDMEESLA